MIQELIKTVFSFPKSKVLPFEHPELMVYDEAHRKGQSQIDCNKIWSCGFSLIQLGRRKRYKEKENGENIQSTPIVLFFSFREIS